MLIPELEFPLSWKFSSKLASGSFLLFELIVVRDWKFGGGSFGSGLGEYNSGSGSGSESNLIVWS